ncbi:hypothetical protein AVEN_131910-1 [Araneus ventricosus]|uniref:Uncharacterized protein n=1 Tax=Araneus ventricosus TaxID=182803 RepID=A0A4Y2LC98_ARAVE|nr:hypothetical protein AVEN_131910-1 [Araneus ventricosus]
MGQSVSCRSEWDCGFAAHRSAVHSSTSDWHHNPVICDCSLQWYMSRYRGTLKGNCAGPEDRKGKSFLSLTPSDFSYCT